MLPTAMRYNRCRKGAKCCDQHFCLSTRISPKPYVPIHCMWPWLSLLLTTMLISLLPVLWMLAAVFWRFQRPSGLLVLLCSFSRPRPRVGHTLLHLSLSSVILTDSSRGSPVHVLMLSIQAVRGLPRLRAPGIVPCIISFFGATLPCFLVV